MFTPEIAFIGGVPVNEYGYLRDMQLFSNPQKRMFEGPVMGQVPFLNTGNLLDGFIYFSKHPGASFKNKAFDA